MCNTSSHSFLQCQFVSQVCSNEIMTLSPCACSTQFRGFFGCFSSFIWRIHFVLLSFIIFPISIYLEHYSDFLVSSLKGNPWHYRKLALWSVLVKTRLCHEHHFQEHPMSLWFKGGTLMWIFQWVRWKYPCSPSMNYLPVISFQEIRKNLFFVLPHLC